MLPLLPHNPAVCLLIVIQSLILFIPQILIRSPLVPHDGGSSGGTKLSSYHLTLLLFAVDKGSPSSPA